MAVVYPPSVNVMTNFPWSQLQALPFNYGEPGVTPPPDTTPPTVSLSAPIADTTTPTKISGVTTISAAASDSVGVASVQFEVDGQAVGSPVTTSPYSYSWNTTTVANGSYTLTAVAKDTAGNTATATSVTVTVDNADTTPPSVPAGLTATAANSAQVNLSWTASTDNVGVTSYKIYRNGSSTALATVTAPTTTYQDAAVSAATAYSYTVTALDAAGNESAKSTSVSVTTPAAPDKTPPSVPTGLHTTATTNTSISLAWNASTDNTGGSGLAGYHVYRNGTLIASPSTTSYVDTSVTAGSSYTYTVSAYDKAANGSVASSAITAKAAPPPDTTPPSVPTSLAATAANSAQVNISWHASTDNVGVTEYKIYRNGSTTALATIAAPATSYQDDAVSAATAYSYTVTALDAAGNQSAKSSAANVTTPAAPDKTPPSVPTNLHSTATTTTSISLAWNASTDNTGGSGLAGYHVYRNGTLIASPSTNSYTDSGLTASTSYSYSVSAYDKAANGSVASGAVSVKTATPPDTTPPSVPSGLKSTATTTTSVTLSWTASTDTGGSGLAGYHVYRNGTLIASPTTTTYTASGLTATTSYTFSVSAYDNAANGSVASGAITVKTATPPDTTPPSVPAGLTATAANSAQVNLSWTASTDNVGVTSYKIYRNGSTTALATVTAPATSYQDDAVSADTAYTYQVTALDAAGNQSAESASASVSTPPTPDKTPPSVPSGLKSTSATTTSVSLTWDASTDNTGGSGLAGYHVYRNGTLIASPSTTTYSDIGLTPDTSYIYSVSAYDKAANGSVASDPITVKTATPPDTTPPSVPTNLHSTATTTTSVSLTWDASTDNTGGSGLAGYHLYRNGTLIASPSGTTYVDTGLTSGTSYTYTVSAYDNAANGSVASSAVTVKTAIPPDTTPPSVPAGLTTIATTTTSISISWDASTDTGGSGLAGYHLYRNGILIASPSTTTYSDIGLTPDTSYTYSVSAYDNAGNGSVASSAITVKTATPPPPADTTPPSVPAGLSATAANSAQVNLSWQASTDNVGVTEYKVYRNGSSTALATITAPATTYQDAAVSAGTGYSYQVTALDAAGNQSAESTSVSVTTPPAADHTPPSAPTGLKATAITSTSISLAWNASTDNTGGSGLAGYHVYRNGVLIASPATTSYTDTGLTAATGYTYSVSAYDNAANGSVASSSLGVFTRYYGDFLNNGVINIVDLSILLSNYGKNYGPAEWDHHSTVDLQDLSILLSNYGK
jgi:chitodextrinase